MDTSPDDSESATDVAPASDPPGPVASDDTADAVDTVDPIDARDPVDIDIDPVDP
jgi:hypothetical protein